MARFSRGNFLNISHEKSFAEVFRDFSIYFIDISYIIKRADGSIVIWEHFGREHDKVYMAKNRVRIQDYISLGYRPWDNLIWTLDSDIKDSHNIRRIIKRFMLTTV